MNNISGLSLSILMVTTAVCTPGWTMLQGSDGETPSHARAPAPQRSPEVSPDDEANYLNPNWTTETPFEAFRAGSFLAGRDDKDQHAERIVSFLSMVVEQKSPFMDMQYEATGHLINAYGALNQVDKARAQVEKFISMHNLEDHSYGGNLRAYLSVLVLGVEKNSMAFVELATQAFRTMSDAAFRQRLFFPMIQCLVALDRWDEASSYTALVKDTDLNPRTRIEFMGYGAKILFELNIFQEAAKAYQALMSKCAPNSQGWKDAKRMMERAQGKVDDRVALPDLCAYWSLQSFSSPRVLSFTELFGRYQGSKLRKSTDARGQLSISIAASKEAHHHPDEMLVYHQDSILQMLEDGVTPAKIVALFTSKKNLIHSPSHMARFYLFLATKMMIISEYDLALQAAQRVSCLAKPKMPEFFDQHMVMGQIYEKQQQMLKAALCYRTALIHLNGNPAAHRDVWSGATFGYVRALQDLHVFGLADSVLQKFEGTLSSFPDPELSDRLSHAWEDQRLALRAAQEEATYDDLGAYVQATNPPKNEEAVEGLLGSARDYVSAQEAILAFEALLFDNDEIAVLTKPLTHFYARTLCRVGLYDKAEKWIIQGTAKCRGVSLARNSWAALAEDIRRYELGHLDAFPQEEEKAQKPSPTKKKKKKKKAAVPDEPPHQLVRKATTFKEGENYSEALRYAKAALAKSDCNPKDQLSAAECILSCYYNLGDIASCKKHALLYAEQLKDIGDAQYTLLSIGASALRQSKRWLESIELGEKALAGTTKGLLQIRALTTIVRNLKDAEEYSKAARKLKMARTILNEDQLQNTREESWILIYSVEVFSELGIFAEARTFLSRLRQELLPVCLISPDKLQRLEEYLASKEQSHTGPTFETVQEYLDSSPRVYSPGNPDHMVDVLSALVTEAKGPDEELESMIRLRILGNPRANQGHRLKAYELLFQLFYKTKNLEKFRALCGEIAKDTRVTPDSRADKLIGLAATPLKAGQHEFVAAVAEQLLAPCETGVQLTRTISEGEDIFAFHAHLVMCKAYGPLGKWEELARHMHAFFKSDVTGEEDDIQEMRLWYARALYSLKVYKEAAKQFSNAARLGSLGTLDGAKQRLARKKKGGFKSLQEALGEEERPTPEPKAEKAEKKKKKKNNQKKAEAAAPQAANTPEQKALATMKHFAEAQEWDQAIAYVDRAIGMESFDGACKEALLTTLFTGLSNAGRKVQAVKGAAGSLPYLKSAKSKYSAVDCMLKNASNSLLAFYVIKLCKPIIDEFKTSQVLAWNGLGRSYVLLLAKLGHFEAALVFAQEANALNSSGGVIDWGEAIEQIKQQQVEDCELFENKSLSEEDFLTEIPQDLRAAFVEATDNFIRWEDWKGLHDYALEFASTQLGEADNAKRLVLMNCMGLLRSHEDALSLTLHALPYSHRHENKALTYYTLGDLYANLKQRDLALSSLRDSLNEMNEAGLQGSSNYEEVCIRYVRTLIICRVFDEAITFLQERKAFIEEGQWNVLNTKAGVQRLVGGPSYKTAQDYIDSQAGIPSKKVGTTPTTTAFLIQWHSMLKLRKGGDHKATIAQMKKVLSDKTAPQAYKNKTNEMLPEIYAALGQAYDEQENSELLLDALGPYLKKNPTSNDHVKQCHLYVARALYRLERYVEAASHFNEAGSLRGDNRNQATFCRKAVKEAEKKKKEKGKTPVEKGLTSGPARVVPRFAQYPLATVQKVGRGFTPEELRIRAMNKLRERIERAQRQKNLNRPDPRRAIEGTGLKSLRRTTSRTHLVEKTFTIAEVENRTLAKRVSALRDPNNTDRDAENFRKIEEQLKDDPTSGEGHPHPLNHGKYKGMWSRDLQGRHSKVRLIYKIQDGIVTYMEISDSHYK